MQVVRAVERYKHDAMVEASVLDELAQLDPKGEWCVVEPPFGLLECLPFWMHFWSFGANWPKFNSFKWLT